MSLDPTQERRVYNAVKRSVETMGALDPESSAIIAYFGRSGAARFGDLVGLAASDAGEGHKFMRAASSPQLAAFCRFLYVHVVGNAKVPQEAVTIGALVMREDRRGFLARDDLVAYVRRTADRNLFRRKRGQKGGATLGVGREGTRVYTGNEISAIYPTARRLCVFEFTPLGAQGGPACTPTASSKAADPDIAIKDIPDDSSAIAESQIHQRVHAWFSGVAALEWTPLHPTINCVDVERRVDGKTHRLLVFRAFDGDVSYVTLKERDLWAVAHATLKALEVLHANGMVHLDVKPHNILWTETQPTENKAAASNEGGEFSFCLGDYGVVTSAASVMANAVRGGSPSGTDGYISPLLLEDDSENGVFPAFKRVARLCAVPPFKPTPDPKGAKRAKRTKGTDGADDDAWAAYFRFHRVATVDDVYKADLQSLALALLHLARANDLVLPKKNGLIEFVASLMFFRPGDHFSAKAALANLPRP